MTTTGVQWVAAASTASPDPAAVRAALGHADRTWFVDPRSPERRLGVSVHHGEQLAVLSLWHGDVCSGTFQLPLVDAARLVGALVDGLAAALPAPVPPAAAPPRTPWWRGLLDRWRRAAPEPDPTGLRLVE
jgi:hypothetical protein